MEMTLADNYYLKAISDYPYNLQEVAENLNYALSYDEDHAQSLCLLGQMQMFVFKEYQVAEVTFRRALCADLDYPETYPYFALLKIKLKDFDGAEKLLLRAAKVPGTELYRLDVIMGLIKEAQSKWTLALFFLRRAKIRCLDNEKLSEINKAMRRVKRKSKQSNSGL